MMESMEETQAGHTIQFGDAAGQGKNQADGKIGHGIDVDTGRIRTDHACRGSRRQVDCIVANATPSDHFKRWGSSKDPGGVVLGRSERSVASLQEPDQVRRELRTVSGRTDQFAARRLHQGDSVATVVPERTRGNKHAPSPALGRPTTLRHTGLPPRALRRTEGARVVGLRRPAPERPQPSLSRG